MLTVGCCPFLHFIQTRPVMLTFVKYHRSHSGHLSVIHKSSTNMAQRSLAPTYISQAVCGYTPYLEGIVLCITDRLWLRPLRTLQNYSIRLYTYQESFTKHSDRFYNRTQDIRDLCKFLVRQLILNKKAEPAALLFYLVSD